MATDATGTPTAKGIPTYDTSNDTPSGLGFNAAMQAIDTLLDSYAGKPSGIASGEAPVWNGSAWARSSVTKLLLDSLAQGGATSGQAMTWNGSAWAPTTIQGVPAGALTAYAGNTGVPTGWLYCDGTAYSRATYADLWAALSDSKGTATITIASPGVVTNTGHALAGGERVHFTTTGALPTGLAVDTDYWVIPVDANTFRLASSQANYLTSTAINTSGTQSGTHTLWHAPYGISGSSNFLVPDLRGRAPFGVGSHIEMAGRGINEGAALGDRSASHHHLEDPAPSTGGYSGSGYGANYAAPQAKTTGNQNLQDKPAYLTTIFIIKT